MRIKVDIKVQIDDGPVKESNLLMGSEDYPAEEIAPLTVAAVVHTINDMLDQNVLVVGRELTFEEMRAVLSKSLRTAVPSGEQMRKILKAVEESHATDSNR